MSHFQCPQFSGSSYISGKFTGPCTKEQVEEKILKGADKVVKTGNN